MKIIINNNQRKIRIDKEKYKEITNSYIIAYLNKFIDYNLLELYVSFVSKNRIRELKNELFSMDVFTDVITVPIDANDSIDKNIPSVFGEIFICPEVALEQSKKYGHSVEDELILLLVHGLLHMVGYCDETSDEKRLMRRKEKEVIKKLGL